MATAADVFGVFTARLSGAGLPGSVQRAAGLHALDALGCGLAGFGLDEAPYATGLIEPGSQGPSSTIGTHPLPARDAAFVNGTYIHALDFDDTHPHSVVHVSASVVPAALAVAQAAGSSGADVLAALVAGNEVSVRLGNAASGAFHARGLHPTGVCGVFGATAAAARAARLDAWTTAQAFGIAGSFASGLLEFLADGSETKRLHGGWAAQAGVSAAKLAAAGATGPSTVFEGDRGFFAAYLHGHDYDLDRQLAGLGSQWVTEEIAYKPYPACHYTHAPVDALGEILAANPLCPGDIESITGLTDATGVGLVCEPAVGKVHPRTPYDAKFSLPWALAYRLVHGRLDVTSFTAAALEDSEVHELTPRIGYELRQYAPTPDAFGGGVRIRTRDGRTFEAELRYQRGGAENPLADHEIVRKYRTNAALVLSDEDAGMLQDGLLSLVDHSDAQFLSVLSRSVAAIEKVG